MDSEPQISVVIPVLDGECYWKDLIADLTYFSDAAEFLFISNGNQPQEFTELAHQNQIESRSHWYRSSVGRAIQMNRGASEACGSSLLFLHSDSRLSETGIGMLMQSFKIISRGFALFQFKISRSELFPDETESMGSLLSITYFGGFPLEIRGCV